MHEHCFDLPAFGVPCFLSTTWLNPSTNSQSSVSEEDINGSRIKICNL
jgi:hypothetical protein